MACYPHSGKGAAKRRLLDAIATLSTVSSAGGNDDDAPSIEQRIITARSLPAGRWILVAGGDTFNVRTIRDLADDGLITWLRPEVRLTPVGVTWAARHAEEHAIADAKARQARSGAPAHTHR